MRHERRDHEHHRFCNFTRNFIRCIDRLRDVIVEFDEFCDRSVKPKCFHFGPNDVDRSMKKPAGLVICAVGQCAQFASLFDHHCSPEALEEAEHADDIAGFPWSACVEWPHRHFVEPECVGAIRLVHLVGGDRVFEALTHLSPLTSDLIAVEIKGAISLLNRERINVNAALIFECIGEDVALVEEARVGLFRTHVAEVVEHLVPEACVQQVQHRVLHSANVEINATRVVRTEVGSWPHPVALNLRVDKAVIVRWVEVTKFVPTRACPLWHDVGISTVCLESIAEVELQFNPVTETIERAFRVAVFIISVERSRTERVGLRQHDGEHVVRKGVCVAVFVVDDGEGFSPVALTTEEPVAKFVVDGCFTTFVAFKPPVGRCNSLAHRTDSVEIEGVVC